MGYIKFDTVNDGQIIVDASKVLTVKKQGDTTIDFVIQLKPADGNQGEIRLKCENRTDSTVEKFNSAVIAAQAAQEVVVKPSGSEIFRLIAFDPTI